MKSVNTFLLLAFVCLGAGHATAADRIEFNRDVRPILSNKCFKCHGFDEKSREADLRLDLRESATADRGDHTVIAPGTPDKSELIRRIESADPSERMPPPDSNKTLSLEERNLLRRWIESGAEYQSHWSLSPPHARPLPKIHRSDWPRNPIDYFVLEKLEREGLQPSPEARPEILLRRASLDLTGLPPTPEELDAFLEDPLPDGHAFERAVDRLLASPHFGERMAVDWLDLARYADTNGYFGDKPRSIWLWRNWVIDANNRNLPFDQFTIEQLAGDLLPNATTAQKIATGFNRNHMANNETGLIDEEYRVEYVADRLETTAAAWLGLTIGCARCHDHKFDPLTQKEFYQLFAFFNNAQESGLITQDNPPPVIEVPTAEQQQKLKELVAAQEAAVAAFAPIAAELQKQMTDWEKRAAEELAKPPYEKTIAEVDFEDRIPGKHVGTTIQYERGVLGKSAKFDATQHAEIETSLDLNTAWAICVWLKADSSLSCVLSKIEPVGNRRGMEILWQKGKLHVHLVNQWGVKALEVVTAEPVPSKSWNHLVLDYDGSGKAAGVKIYLNGRPAAVNVERDSLTGTLTNSEPLRIARRDSGLGFYGELDELRILQRTAALREVESWYWSERLRGIMAISPDARSAADKEVLLDYYLDNHADEPARQARQKLIAARQAVGALRAAIPTTLVMQELPQPRKSSVLTRGQYDHPAEAVQPDVPSAIGSWPADYPRNRWGLARWLVSPSHPLTSRVAVNRLWQQCFGEGLVRTVNDFGSQGELPTHPELLDWFAVTLVQSGWDVKAMLRLIVTSATYRQSSAATQSLLQRDIDNRMLARGPSFRLPAELVRDQALASSGLLISRIGGPSVKPYQPPGLWELVSYNGEEIYVADQGEGLWRRSLYTYWKRQSPPPALLTFDGPTREKCTVRRPRTNTPLQALVLLNDETYLAAARQLAASILKEGGGPQQNRRAGAASAPGPVASHDFQSEGHSADPRTAQKPSGNDAHRLRMAFRQILSREPEQQELAILESLLERQRAIYAGQREKARQVLAVETPAEFHHIEWAAWTMTVHAILNLDETITRR